LRKILSEDEKTLLRKTASLMEELIETVEVSEDEKLQDEVREALAGAKRGEARPLKQLLRELGIDV